MNLAKNIKYLRQKKGYTQKQLGEVIGANQAQIAGYEKGRSKPLFDNLVKLKEVFEVSLDELVYQDLQKYPPGSNSFESEEDLRIINQALIERIKRMGEEMKDTPSARKKLQQFKEELLKNDPDLRDE